MLWLGLILVLAMSQPVYAGAIDVLYGTSIPDGTCTSQETITIKEGTGTATATVFAIEEPESGKGMISGIIDNVTQPLDDVAQTTFEGIVQNKDFQNSIRAAASIYVFIYGLFFTFGMVQITTHDLLVRLSKLAILFVLLSQNAWGFFDTFVVTFFNGAVDDVIRHVSTIAIGTSDNAAALVGAPFDPLDQALVYIVSAKMAVTLLATFATGPYGVVIGLILAMALGSFLKAMFNALWIYIMGYVIRTMMFGMAPLFIVCILFSRTRHIFDGWLNQIVNATLQPIFLFTFFAFFVLLIKACILQVLEVPICWMPTLTQSGTPEVTHFWRFSIKDCDVFDLDGNQVYRNFDGTWGLNGPEGNVGDCNKGIPHPLGIILPLMIWLLADLAGRFNHIVIEIAKDISNAATDLTMGAEGIKKWFSEVTEFGSMGKTGPGNKPPANLGELGQMLRPPNPAPARPAEGMAPSPGVRPTPGAKPPPT